LLEEEERLLLDVKEFRISLTEETPPELRSYIGSEVIMGIRPEDLCERVSASAEGTKQGNMIRMTIDLVEPVGPYVLLHLKAGQVLIVATVKETKAKAGQEVIMEVNPSRIHIFDKGTTNAIM
jgi:ABC-type sugar transport system ATPase subunit